MQAGEEKNRLTEYEKRENRDRQTLAWIWRVAGTHKWYVFWLTLVQAAYGASGIWFAWVLRAMIDHAVSGERQMFVHTALLLAGIVAGQLTLRAFVRWLTERANAGVENAFKSRLFSALLKKDYASVTAVHSGEWMNRLTSDTVAVASGVTSIVPEVAGMLVKMAGALVSVILLAPVFACVLIPCGVLLVGFSYAFRRVLKRLHKRIQEADGGLRIFLSERLANLLIVRSFSQEARMLEEADALMGVHMDARMRRNRFSNLCNIGFGSGMQGLYVIGAIYCGYGILTGGMSYGTFTAVLQLIGQVQAPFANITGYLPKYYAMLASAERLMEAEQFADDGMTGDRMETGQRADAGTAERLPQAYIAECYQTSFRGIGLSGVSFSYSPRGFTGVPEAGVSGVGVSGADVSEAGAPGSDDAGQETRVVTLSDVSLYIAKGDYVAVTGPSGCGKSTMLKLLMSLYTPERGERYILCADRMPLTAAWRGLFAYVPQGNQLLCGTIREIITFQDPEKMRQGDAIMEALQIACAAEFVRALPDGLDTRLGEKGAGLSEGQIQRIAIARAVFSARPVLLLDEVTSSLDEKTEADVLSNLRRMTDRTVVIVTHRSRALSVCSKQIAMEAGRWHLFPCVQHDQIDDKIHRIGQDDGEP